MADWTISGGDFSADTFAAAGLSRLKYTLQNGGQDSASFHLAGDADGTPPLAEKDDVTLSYDGDVMFRGYVRTVQAGASGSAEGFSVELDGAMMKLSRTPLLQRIAVAGETAETDAYAYSGKVTLGFDDDGNRLNLADTITDLLDSTAADHGLTSGTILAGHDVTAPQMDMADAMVSDALARVLSWIPDAVLWFDHGADAVNVTKPAGLAGVSIAGSGAGSGSVQVTLNKKRRLSVPGVIIIWETTTTVDGVEKVTLTQDTAGTVSPLLDVPVITIPLSGVRFDTLSQTCKTATIPRGVSDFTQEEWAAWLKAHFKEFANWNLAYPAALVIMECAQTVDVDSKTGLGEVPEFDPDGEGERYVLGPAYPRQLLAGAVPEWQSGISAAPVHISIKVRPSAEYASAPELAKIFAGEEEQTRRFAIDVTGTDAQSITYATVINYEGGEEPIAGLAADWYAALNASAPSFTIELVGAEPVLTIYPGKALTLTGDFGVSNAVVQAVTVDVDNGRTLITTGPQSRLTPADLVELMRAGSRRSPLANRSGAHRTSATPDGKVIKGHAAARVKNTAVAAPSPTRFGFAPYLSAPGVVKVSAGYLIWNEPRGPDSSPAFEHYVDSHTELVAETEITDIANGDFIWAKVRRDRTLMVVITEPSSEEFCMDAFIFADVEINHGEALPDPEDNMSDIWPLGKYGEADGVETVEVYHSQAPIYCPYLTWSYHSS